MYDALVFPTLTVHVYAICLNHKLLYGFTLHAYSYY